jgi:SNF2 family DNA or RNA helicase
MSTYRKIPRKNINLSNAIKHCDNIDFDKILDNKLNKNLKYITDVKDIETKYKNGQCNIIIQNSEKQTVKYNYKERNKYTSNKNEVNIPNLLLPLKEHQQEAIEWMCKLEYQVKYGINPYNIKGGILSDAPGLGKTLSTLCLCIKESLDNPEYETGFPNLVVCPKIIIDEWCGAITKFFGNNYPYIAIKNNKIVNGKEFNIDNINDIDLNNIKKYKFVITNYEYINSIVKEFYNDELEEKKKDKEMIELRNPFDLKLLNNKKGKELLSDINWNRVICDESHRLNNSNSKTFMSLMYIISNRRWCLTGTPIRNYEKDIYHQFLFLGYNNYIGKSRFTYNQYRSDKLHKHILKRSYSDVNVEMPEFEEKYIYIELTDKEKELYNNIKEYLRIAYKQFSNGYESFSNILHLFLRLRQMCVSSYSMIRQLEKLNDKKVKNLGQIDDIDDKVNTDMSNLVNELVPNDLNEWVRDKYGSAGYMSSKITSVINILKSINKGEKILIFTCFKTHMDILKESIEKYINVPKSSVLILNGDYNEKDRQEILESFKKSNVNNIMIVNYKLGSEGLNLMEANNVILCENWWCPSVMEQAKHRAYRIGQKRKVFIYNIITKNTIEEKIKKICDKKEELEKSFMNDVFDVSKNYGMNISTLKKILF